MEKSILDSKLNDLFSFVIDSSKYQVSLFFTINSRQWDLSIVILYKYLILFLYERLSHLEKDNLITRWNAKFYPSGVKTLVSIYNLDNLYWPNEIQDDILFTFIKDYYGIEDNVIKQMRILSTDRNRCAHVSELETVENEFYSFLEKEIKIMSIIQKSHGKFLLTYELNSGSRYSEKDIRVILPEKIRVFTNSVSFSSSEKNEKILEKFIPYFQENDLKMLLEGIFDNQKRGLNQVLEASMTPVFLKILLSKTKNYYEPWLIFWERLKITYGNSFPQEYEFIAIEIIPF